MCVCVFLTCRVVQRVKALQKELSGLKMHTKGAKQIVQESLNGNSDMQNGKREKGSGYWDKEVCMNMFCTCARAEE